MTDSALRALERAVLSDPSQRAAWLAARLRAGEECVHDRLDDLLLKPCPRCAGFSFRSRLELAAYCGDGAAREVVPKEWEWLPFGLFPPSYDFVIPRADEVDWLPLNRWLSGLSRWGQAIPVRAACAAARVALIQFCKQRYPLETQSRLACRAIEAAEAWLLEPTEERLGAWEAASPHEHNWLPQPVNGLDAANIQAAARLTSPEAVRAAIHEALIEWAI